MRVTKLDHTLSPSGPLSFHMIFLLLLAMARCLEKRKQVPRSRLPVRPLCISLNIVFINKAEKKKQTRMRILRTRLALKAAQSSTPVPGTCADPCATRDLGHREMLLRKVQQPCWDPSIDSKLKDPQRLQAQSSRSRVGRLWATCLACKMGEEKQRSSMVLPPSKASTGGLEPSHSRHHPVECPTLPHGSSTRRPCRTACAEIPNARRIDLTKDCLCAPLLFLKGMIFPLGLWYSLFSIIQRIFSIREMSSSIPCPFPHQRIFPPFPPASVLVCLSLFARCHSRQPSSRKHVLPC